MQKENSDMDLANQYEALQKAYAREKKARKLAEKLLEDKARDLYFSNEELKASLEDLKQTQSQLVQSEKMGSVGVLAAGVAHEINNPIAYVQSNLETLSEYVGSIQQLIVVAERFKAEKNNIAEIASSMNQLLDQEDFGFLLGDIEEIVKSSLDGTRKVRKIVADLSEFSALNTPETSDVDVNDLLDKTLQLAWSELKYGVQLEKDYGRVPVITGRSGKLGQVFLNLIINAAHAMSSNVDRPQKLTLKTSFGKSKVFIWISDTGHGIAEDKLASVFDPFYTTKPIGKGTGLGLHISQNIVDNHGGRLRVVDSSTRGTTFEISLPVEPPAVS